MESKLLEQIGFSIKTRLKRAKSFTQVKSIIKKISFSSLFKESNVAKISKPISFFNAKIDIESDRRTVYQLLKDKIYKAIKKESEDRAFSFQETRNLEAAISKPLFNPLDKNEASVVLIVRKKYLKYNDSDTFLLQSLPLKERKVHPSIPFCPQYPDSELSSAFCLGTGFFVSPDIIATAAHILFPYDNFKEEICIIRGYDIKKDISEGFKPIIVKKENIFYPKWEKLAQQFYDYTETTSDWAIFPVISDVGIKNENFVELTREKVKIDQEVYCIGQGLGLPKKLSYGGIVSQNDIVSPFFECRIIIFSGNSGSPLFDAINHQVVGIVIRGSIELHFKEECSCFIPRKKFNTHEGEECQRIAPIQKALEILQND